MHDTALPPPTPFVLGTLVLLSVTVSLDAGPGIASAFYAVPSFAFKESLPSFFFLACSCDVYFSSNQQSRPLVWSVCVCFLRVLAAVCTQVATAEEPPAFSVYSSSQIPEAALFLKQLTRHVRPD